MTIIYEEFTDWAHNYVKRYDPEKKLTPFKLMEIYVRLKFKKG